MVVSSASLLTRVLLGGISALGLVILLELALLTLGSRLPGSVGSVGDTGPAGISSLNIRNIGLEQDFEEVAARPIFTWNRKPVPSGPDEPQPETSEIDSRWELSAIIADGDSHFAYFTPTEGGSQTRLEEGMYFEKWRVMAIGQEQVVLASGDPEDDYEQKTFRLKDISAAKPDKKSRESLAERRRAAREKAAKSRKEPPKSNTESGQNPAS